MHIFLTSKSIHAENTRRVATNLRHAKKDDDNILTKRVDVLIPEVIQVLIYNYSDFRVNYAFITFFVDIKHIAFPN